MDISQLRLTRDLAQRHRAACTFVPGLGYIRVGELRMPEKAALPISACLPPDGAEDGQLFPFIPPGAEAAEIMLRWSAEERLWEPLSPTAGNRLAFRPAFLAAHGWKLADG